MVFPAVVLYKLCSMYISSWHPLQKFIKLEKSGHLLVSKLTGAVFSDILDKFSNSL